MAMLGIASIERMSAIVFCWWRYFHRAHVTRTATISPFLHAFWWWWPLLWPLHVEALAAITVLTLPLVVLRF